MECGRRPVVVAQPPDERKPHTASHANICGANASSSISTVQAPDHRNNTACVFHWVPSANCLALTIHLGACRPGPQPAILKKSPSSAVVSVHLVLAACCLKYKPRQCKTAPSKLTHPEANPSTLNAKARLRSTQRSDRTECIGRKMLHNSNEVFSERLRAQARKAVHT